MEKLIRMWVWVESWVETQRILRNERQMAAIAEAERDVAAGRVSEFQNWGCG